MNSRVGILLEIGWGGGNENVGGGKLKSIKIQYRGDKYNKIKWKKRRKAGVLDFFLSPNTSARSFYDQ